MNRRTILLLAVLNLAPRVASADPITFAFTGHTTSSTIAGVSTNDAFSGRVTFDGATPDGNAPNASGAILGDYTMFGAPYGFDVLLDGQAFHAETLTFVTLLNDEQTASGRLDAYDLESVQRANNDPSSPTDLVRMSLSLTDSSATLFGSTALPTDPAALIGALQFKLILNDSMVGAQPPQALGVIDSIGLGDAPAPCANPQLFGAALTCGLLPSDSSIKPIDPPLDPFAATVPEPATWCLLALAALLLLHRRQPSHA